MYKNIYAHSHVKKYIHPAEIIAFFNISEQVDFRSWSRQCLQIEVISLEKMTHQIYIFMT